MATVHRLSRTDAGRVAIQAQQLAKDRPTGLVETLRRLSLVQLDPTSAVAPSADPALWSRLGLSYDPRELRDAVDEQKLIQLRGRHAAGRRGPRALPRRDGGVSGDRGAARLAGVPPGLGPDHNACRRDILDRLRADGPLPAHELRDTCVLPWASSGWNHHKSLTMMLHFPVQRGEVAVAGGWGRDRLWDLADRVYPADPAIPSEEARRLRDERRLSALGIARSKGPACPVEPLDVGEAGEPADIEGVRGRWRVDPALLGRPFAGRAALLEMCKPAARRRWGHYALPILYGDTLVGKLDARPTVRAGSSASRLCTGTCRSPPR